MEETLLIKHTIVHTLNHCIIELLRRGYQLAMLDELKSLEGLLDTSLDKWMRSDDAELISLDHDLELLSTLEDPCVKIVVESVYKILDCNNTFQMLQSIDLENALSDDEASCEATNILSTYILELTAADTYKNVRDELDTCYTSLSIVLYHCIMMLDLGKTDVWEEGMNSWCSLVSNHGFGYEPKDSSGVLLQELNDELMKDAVDIDKLDRKDG